MKPPTVAEVVAAAVEVTRVPEDCIRGDYRHPQAVAARRATVVAIHTLTYLSFSQIAKQLRGRQAAHSTMHRDYDEGMTDPAVLDMAHQIERRLREIGGKVAKSKATRMLSNR